MTISAEWKVERHHYKEQGCRVEGGKITMDREEKIEEFSRGGNIYWKFLFKKNNGFLKF